VTDAFRPKAVHMNCFDASALVKVYADEVGSSEVRQYFRSESSNYTTLICYFETLTALKMKRFYRKPRDNLTDDEYHKAASELSAWFSLSSKNLAAPDLDLVDSKTFPKVQSLARKYSLDLSDAFQILSVKTNFASVMSGGSQTVLVTADKDLAAAARSEFIKVREYQYDKATSRFVVL
jgi:predicted nucleic acid-binding protein